MRYPTLVQTKSALTLALVAGLSCSNDFPGPNPPPLTPATLLISNQTSGGALDPDGYHLIVDQVNQGRMELNATLQYPGALPGRRIVELSGLADNCVAAEGNPQAIDLAAGETAQLTFTIHCTAPAELGALRLVFARHDGLYTMVGDGSGLTRLAEGAFSDVAVSPDGQWIAFTRDLGLYLIRPDGSGLRLLTTYGWNPSWSPDGTRLVYGGNHGLFTIPLAGGDPSRVTVTSGSGCDYAPAWSPDGTRIAFGRGDCIDVTTLWWTNADGSATEQELTTTLGDGWHIWDPRSPLWSPDGSRLAFLGTNRSGRLSLFVMQAGTLGVSELTPLDASYGLLTDWTPDGSWIAFTRFGDRRSDLYLLSQDGGSVVRVTGDGVTKFAAFLRR